MAVDVQIKETCFGHRPGRAGRGTPLLTEVRKLDPNRLFSKVRGYPIGDGAEMRAETLQAGIHPAGEGVKTCR